MTGSGRRYVRKTNPGVVGGVVQKKHNTALTSNYWNTPQSIPAIDKERPGPGYRHYLGTRHVTEFIELLPDWDELATGLQAVVLSRGREDSEGWYYEGVVAICAWSKDPRCTMGVAYYEEHLHLLSRLGVPCERQGDHYVCKFTDATVRAFQLLHIFMHELGHHHDRMTSRRQVDAARGEGYAEQYARRYGEAIWARYVECVGLE